MTNNTKWGQYMGMHSVAQWKACRKDLIGEIGIAAWRLLPPNTGMLLVTDLADYRRDEIGEFADMTADRYVWHICDDDIVEYGKYLVSCMEGLRPVFV